MKRIVHIILSLLVVFTLTGCSQSTKQLKQMIASLNEECPIPLGAVGQMDKAQYRHGKVTFYYTLIDTFSPDLLKKQEGDFHMFMLENYQYNSDEGFSKLFHAIVDAGADLDIQFQIAGGDTYTVTFTNEELRQHLPGQKSTSEDYLQFAVRSLRMQLPITFNEGMVCHNIELDQDNMTYVIDCDEDQCDIEDMQQNLDHDRAMMVDLMVSSTDPSFVKLMDVLKGAHRGLSYKYQGTTSGKVAVLTILPEELK